MIQPNDILGLVEDWPLKDTCFCINCKNKYAAIDRCERALAAALNSGQIYKRESLPIDGHSGDCSIYSAMINNSPTDGICTCGYGRVRLRECDPEHMYSKERLEAGIELNSGAVVLKKDVPEDVLPKKRDVYEPTDRQMGYGAYYHLREIKGWNSCHDEWMKLINSGVLVRLPSGERIRALIHLCLMSDSMTEGNNCCEKADYLTHVIIAHLKKGDANG